MTTSEELAESFSYMTGDEVAFLKKLVRGLPSDSLAVNIGAGSGTSGLAMLEAREDLKLVTVDFFRGPRPEGALENERRVFNRCGISSNRYHQIKMDSVELALSWPVEGFDSVNLLFVDGNHSYEHTKLDIVEWIPHMKNEGVIAVHDCGVLGDGSSVWPGVRQAVDKLLLGTYPLIEYVDTLIAFEIGSFE